MVFHLIKAIFKLLRAKGILTVREYEHIMSAAREDGYHKSAPDLTVKAIEHICEEAEKRRD